MHRDLITSLIGLWIVVGVYIDGWAHVNDVGVEDFFTPWHATFYSGLVAFAAWVGFLALRAGGLRNLPNGYKAGAIGAAIFGAGGAVDMLWHTLLGIEVSIDALLSPPHLVLLSGVLLMGTTAWRSQRGLSATTTVPELISLTSVVMICGFFLNFLSPFLWAAPSGDFGVSQDERSVVQWIGGLLVFTALFLLPVIWQLRDNRYRFGTLTVFTLATGAAIAIAMSEGWDKSILLAGVAGAAIAALLVEFALEMLPWRGWRYGLPIMMAGAAFTIWSGQLIAYAFVVGIGWPATLWMGTLLYTAGAGAAIGAAAWRPQGMQKGEAADTATSPEVVELKAT